MYRRPGGRRKYIASLERDLPFVLVLLRDDDFRDHAEHTNLDVRGLQRQRVDRGIRVFEGEVRTQGLVVGSGSSARAAPIRMTRIAKIATITQRVFPMAVMLFSHVAVDAGDSLIPS